MSSYILYVLKLEQGRYFVGVTNDIALTFSEHKAGDMTAWTRLFRPKAVEWSHPMIHIHDLDVVTKEYMRVYGIDKVRGGRYTSVKLTQAQHNALKKEFRQAHKTTTQVIQDWTPNDAGRLWYCAKCDKKYDIERECEQHMCICTKYLAPIA